MSSYDTPNYGTPREYMFTAEIVVDKSTEEATDIASVMSKIHNTVGCTLEFIDVLENDKHYTKLLVEVTCEMEVGNGHDEYDAEYEDRKEVIAQIQMLNFVYDVYEV